MGHALRKSECKYPTIVDPKNIRVIRGATIEDAAVLLSADCVVVAWSNYALQSLRASENPMTSLYQELIFGRIGRRMLSCALDGVHQSQLPVRFAGIDLLGLDPAWPAARFQAAVDTLVLRIESIVAGSHVAPPRRLRGAFYREPVAIWSSASIAAAVFFGVGLAAMGLADEAGEARQPPPGPTFAAIEQEGSSQLVATAGVDGVAHVYRDGVLVGSVKGHEGSISSVRFVNGGHTLVTTDSRGQTEMTSLGSLASNDGDTLDSVYNAVHVEFWERYGKAAAAKWLSFLRSVKQRWSILSRSSDQEPSDRVGTNSTISNVRYGPRQRASRLPGGSYDVQKISEKQRNLRAPDNHATQP